MRVVEKGRGERHWVCRHIVGVGKIQYPTNAKPKRHYIRFLPPAAGIKLNLFQFALKHVIKRDFLPSVHKENFTKQKGTINTRRDALLIFLFESFSKELKDFKNLVQ